MTNRTCTDYTKEKKEFVPANMERVAFAMAHIKDPGVSLYGMAKYADQKCDLGRLERLLLVTVLSDNPNWTKRAHKKDSARKMIRLAIVEEISPNICPHCYGQKTVIVGKRLKACIPCKGTGNKIWKDVDRARLVDLDPDAYRMTWKPRLPVIQRYVREWDQKIWNAVL